MAKMISAGVACVIAIAIIVLARELIRDWKSVSVSVGNPDIVVTPESLVFDRVPFRGSAQKPVRFSNTAKYPIQLFSANWSCGCMRMLFQPMVLNPGESVEFMVVMRGDSTPAALKGGEILVETNSSTNATVRIQVTASEVQGDQSLPASVDFGRPEYGKLPMTVPLKILVNGLNDSEVQSVRIQSSHRAVACGNLRKNDDGDLLVDVQLAGISVVGNVSSSLIITGEGFDSLSVPVFAAIRHPLHAHPPSLQMQRKSAFCDVIVRDDNGNPIHIERAVVSPALVELLKCVESEDKHYRVVWINSQSDSGHVVRGEIELHAKDQSGQLISISVPVTAYGAGG